MKTALITEVTGQEGSYLVEFLLKKGCQVHGIKRRSGSLNKVHIDHIYKKVGLRANTLEEVIRVNENFFNPKGVETLLEDLAKSLKKLIWEQKTSLEEMIKEMITFEKKESRKESLLIKEVFSNRKYSQN